MFNPDIDTHAPFNAVTYFKCLREIGVDPQIFDGRIWLNVDATDTEKAQTLLAWSRNADPDQNLQKEYARDKWKNRCADEQIVSLG